MSIEQILPSFLGAGKLACQIVLIIVPLVTIFEIFRYSRIFNRVGKYLNTLLHGLGLTGASSIPLFTGMILGISYGAGILLRTTQEKRITPRELFLVGLFLSACHGVIEDTLIFVVIGGNGWMMFGLRLIMAVIITGLLARIWITKEV